MRKTLDRLQAARREDRGFTLIELLIVIIILGILAAVVVFSVRGITDRGEVNACKTELRTVETAVEAYYASGKGTDGANVYPATLGALVPDFLKGPTDGTYDGTYVVEDDYDDATGEVSGVDCDALG